MKIVHLCLACFYIDNCSYQENILPKYHVKMGNSVTVISSLVSYDSKGQYCLLPTEVERMDKDGYKVIRLNYKYPESKLGRAVRFYKNFYTVLDNEDPEIIFIHGLQFSDLLNVLKYKKRHPHVRIYADNHADYVNSANSFVSKYIQHKIYWRIIIKQISSRIERFYGVTPGRCEFLKEMYQLPQDKIDFLPMGVDDEAIPMNRQELREKLCKELMIPTDSFIVMTGGKIDSAKNTHLLLQALKNMDNIKIHVLVCGIVTPSMTATINALLTPNVHMLGWCDSDKVMKCMVASNLVCFPGSHSTLWEQSVGVGIPGVFKEWTNMTHVDVCGNCVLLKQNNAEEIEEVLGKVVCDTEYYLKLYGRAQKAALSFKYSEIAKKSIGLS